MADEIGQSNDGSEDGEEQEEEEESSSDDDDRENERARSIVVATLATAAYYYHYENTIPSLPGRCSNDHLDRSIPLTEVRSWDDEMFTRQFRLTRPRFNKLLGKQQQLPSSIEYYYV